MDDESDAIEHTELTAREVSFLVDLVLASSDFAYNAGEYKTWLDLCRKLNEVTIYDITITGPRD